ncbi:MAG: YihY/virulence factor BrkB family protein [Halobacteriales archaeon]
MSAATIRAVGRRALDAELTFLGAAIAYYALVSVVPALLLAVAAATTIGGIELADRVVAAAGGLLTPAGEAAIAEALASAAGRAGASALGLAVLAWSALKVFRGLDIAFARIYGTEGRDSFLERLVDATVVVVGVGFALWLMVAVGGALAAIPLPAAAWALGLLGLLVGLFAAFLPLYYVFPDVPMSVRRALPGTTLAAAGWVGLQAGFQAYAAAVPSYELYGVLGGVLLLVTWFYLAAGLLLLGATVNVELAGRAVDRQAEEPGDRGVVPTMDADGDETLEEEVAALREAVEALETRLEEHTVPRSAVEADLRRYVRARVRRGHARGWGPYLVLLYGTAMTVAAFELEEGGWAILAMLVVWLSTLGLYVVMVVAGAAVSAIELPGRALDAVRDRRS